jgi:PhzF family phenazine biosynthesis protein
MVLNIYQVDAFTRNIFGGNPAAVCPLKEWLDDSLMLKIANENNLSETAFFVKNNGSFDIRWFTPATEVDLCGHATLASAYIIFNILNYPHNHIIFNSSSGQLKVGRKGDLITLNFPSRYPSRIDIDPVLSKSLKLEPSEVLFDKTTLCVYENEDQIRKLEPNIRDFLKIDTHGIIITAPGDNVDFVSRFFAPDVGIDEDPVTGYAHTLLIPYWSKRLRKKELHALQVSEREGELFCKSLGERVEISGFAALYLEGKINI